MSLGIQISIGKHSTNAEIGAEPGCAWGPLALQNSHCPSAGRSGRHALRFGVCACGKREPIAVARHGSSLIQTHRGEWMLRIAAPIGAFLLAVTSANAETIDVKYFGSLDLKTFDCTTITRSSFVNRACYDKAKRFMVVQLKDTYY